MFPSHYTSSQIAGKGKSPKQGQGILEARDLGRVRWREKERAKKKECGLENRFPVLKSEREKDCRDRAIGSSSIHREPTQCVCVADCYFIVNVLDLPFASLIAIYR